MTNVLHSLALDAGAYARAAFSRDYAITVEVARHDPSTFCRLVLRDEETGGRIEQAPVHDTWHDLLTHHKRAVFWSHVEGGKTNQVSIGRVLWELGKNPQLRVAVISRTAGMATKIIQPTAQYIERSADLHAVFPHLVPTRNKRLPWNQHAITVEREGIAKDPSVQAFGVMRGAIVGSRVDLLVLDDILDETNTRSPDHMDALMRWLKSSAFSRLTKDSRVWVVGNAWHPLDPMHRLVAESGYDGFRFPVETPTGELTWPKRWTRPRIEAKRRELGSLEFARQMLCQARNDAEASFKREWVDRAVAMGDGYELVHQVDELPPGFGIFTGVDLAVAQHNHADWTVFLTVLVYPHDHPTHPGVRQVLWVEAGRWTAPEIVKRIDDHARRYGGLQVVENVAAQQYILQFARLQSAATLKAFTTGRNKADPSFGVASLAAELEADRWLLPNRRGVLHPELHQLVQEMLFYDPSPKKHTGDRLMAMWFAREGARMWERRLARAAGAALGAPGAPAGGLHVVGGGKGTKGQPGASNTP